MNEFVPIMILEQYLTHRAHSMFTITNNIITTIKFISMSELYLLLRVDISKCLRRCACVNGGQDNERGNYMDSQEVNFF